MITKDFFGALPDGQEITRFTFTNTKDIQVSVIDYGAIITNIIMPDKNGTLDDIALSYKNLEAYTKEGPYLGATIGRSVGRITPAEITINGKSYPLAQNSGNNNIHGGLKGLDKRFYTNEIVEEGGEEKLVLNTLVPHLADDFPGDLSVEITFSLADDGAFNIEYYAVSSEDTMINLTNHSYFNLAGHSSGNIYDHSLQVSASFVTSNHEDGLLQGINRVDNTPFDLRTANKLGGAVKDHSHPQIARFNGIDHGFLLEGEGYRKVGKLSHSNGRTIEVFTSECCLQVYTSNMLNDEENPNNKDGASYGVHDAICLETQNLPNNNHFPWLKSSIYKKNIPYTSKTTYKFTVE